MASSDAWLMPPKKASFGSLAPTLGCLIVALPIPMAITLQAIITRPTFGDQETVAGAMAKRGLSMKIRGNDPFSVAQEPRPTCRKGCSSLHLLRFDQAGDYHGIAEGEEGLGTSMQWINRHQFGVKAKISNHGSHDGDSNNCLLYTSPSPRD